MGGDECVLYVLSVPTRSMILNTIQSSPIRSVAFSRHDERLAIGLDDGVLSLLCPEADWEPAGDIDFNESAILCQAWTSKTFAVGRMDGTVTLFDTEKAYRYVDKIRTKIMKCEDIISHIVHFIFDLL
jgi:WD40 repeat protein